MRGSDGRTGERGDEDEGEVGEEFGEGGTVRRGRGGKGGRNLGRKHSRASSLDRREIYQKYIHTDRSVQQFCIAKQIHPNSQALSEPKEIHNNCNVMYRLFFLCVH